MLRCCPASWLHRRLPSRGPPHWPPPYSGPASSRAATRHPSIGTDPETGVACQLWLCWLCPAGRLASGAPIQQCPAEVACAGCVLPSRPSPCSGLSPPLSTTRDKTPPRHTAGFPSDSTPPPSWRGCRSSAEVPAVFRLRVSPAVPQELYTVRRRVCRAGASGASQVLRRLSSCMPRPEDSGGPALPCHTGWARVAFGSVHTLGVRKALSKLYQHVRVRGHPCGLQDSVSTLRPSCSPRVPPRLRHGRKTRYGWVARPYPTGTCTLQETPSFSWRENARFQVCSIAGARHEQRLLSVACKPF